METEFLEKAQVLFNRIEQAADGLPVDIDSERNGNVLTLESQTGEQVVLNVHAPTSEVWLTSRAGGYRFASKDGKWIAPNGTQELQEALEQALSYICSTPVRFSQKI